MISNLKLQGTLLRNFHKNHDVYLPRHNTQKTTQQNCRCKSEIVKKYPDKFCEMVANLIGKWSQDRRKSYDLPFVKRGPGLLIVNNEWRNRKLTTIIMALLGVAGTSEEN